jgi:hypothetical protein
MIEVPDSKEFMEKKEGVCPIVVLSRYKKCTKSQTLQEGECVKLSNKKESSKYMHM